ncbi:NAD-dependent epimerase/dehydratase family protein [Brevibacterium oceani]|uniref:NAD-dependent epimerase/dehydratase family protein n=1 Tax=Brevibacterium oceani TaxID=358099 RepID=UPI001B331C4D|nr:NAD-dependent epimerase/dehydratase family protein [Brevibacterium oceani]
MTASRPHLLVTGGAGFIGAEVVAAALREGWKVTVLDSFRSDVHAGAVDAAELLGRFGEEFTGPGLGAPASADLRIVGGDVADPQVLDQVLPGIDAVSHQAAKVGLGVDFADSPDYVASNELATSILLAAMARHGVRDLVLASSMVVYGEGAYRDEQGPIDAGPRTIADLEAGRFDPVSPRTNTPLTPELISEDATPDPRNVYAVTKLGQEMLAAAWARATGGRAVFLRYHNVYGPHMPQGTPYAGIASIFRSVLQAGGRPRVFEDGAQRRDFIHVSDVASANIAGLDFARTQGPGTVRAFNVASGDVTTIGQMAEALSSALGGPEPVITGEYRLGDVRHITASAQRIRTELGWRPRIGFAEGMAEFARAPMREPVGSSARPPAGNSAGPSAEDSARPPNGSSTEPTGWP